ncbi:MAG: twin-arginine translocation pathway signal protein [Roseovarius sp.]
MKRRHFLALAGGGVILAAGGFALTRTPHAALAPWAEAGAPRYDDPRLNALSHAILAPNPHNRQPWLVELEGSDGVTLRFDTSRQLPHTDPFDRQLTIGLGCFLELMRMAAAANGYRAEMETFPEGHSEEGLDTRPVARARFTADSALEPDLLWPHVPARRSNKEPFDTTRPVPQPALDRILAEATEATPMGGTVAPQEVQAWRALTEDALRIEIETPRTYQESVDLFRIGKREINANPDGIDFSGPLFEALHLTGQFTRETALDTSSAAYIQGIDAVLENCRTATGHVWMVTPTNTRDDQLAAGATWLRANLAATREGLSFQPLSQALQEYPEMAAHYRTVHERLAPDGGTVQMLSRLGYGPEVQVSPRWPLEAKLVTA